MALQLDLTTPQGVTARYHRIDRVEAEFGASQVTVHLLSYVDREARVENGCAFWSLIPALCIPIGGDGGVAEPDRVSIYQALLTLPDFASATRV